MEYLTEFAPVNLMKFAKKGRKTGRKLTNYRKKLLEDLLPKYKFDAEKIKDGNFKEIWCEIGFGQGERIIEDSEKNKEILQIGVEFFINGIANLLANIQKKESNNIIIWPSDAESFFKNIEDNFIDKLFILFPDPWPKKKHQKRRIINKEFLDLISEKMKKDGNLIIATDHKQYGLYILNQLRVHPNYHWKSSKSRDYFQEPPDWVTTKYQKNLVLVIKNIYS